MLYVLFGPDSFSRQEALAQLKAKLDPDGMLDSSATVLEARQSSPQEVMAACDTVPFLANRRLVIVQGALQQAAGAPGRRGRRSGAGEGGPWLALADYVPRMPPSTVLVLLDDDVSPDNPLLQALRPHARVRHFRPPDQRGLPDWIRRRARALGLSLTPGALGLLTDLVGNDLWTLSRELEKLSAYGADGRPVGEEEVRSLVAAAREVSIFPLIDAIVEGRGPAALRLLRQMFRQGRGASYIFAMIQRQYRNLIIAREMLEAGATSRQIGERLRVGSYGLEKLLQQALACPPERLRQAFRRLLEADLSIKRGIYGEELALELLVQELAFRRPAAVTRPG